ncbi:dTDP-glucose 4,6-dehydratase [Sphingosinicella soli]|uniref:dTDP-glucose 4,6-dehydratase n=1 Tax=Sphingosinicella soli TaxID=333708 RepID=A0A7W7F8C2_9SPHN|nr:dTDP-glucose 4,6-dehydratase [Sphingosinicella soli]
MDLILSETETFWQAFRGARLLVTGGTGFIGSWLVETVLRANAERGADIRLAVLTRAPEHACRTAPHAFVNEAVELIAGDVTTIEPKLGSIDACIHAATDVGEPVRAADHLAVFDSCVTGTRRILDACIAGGARHFLLLSSGAVYGTQPTNIDNMPELMLWAPDTSDPASGYGEGKRAAEWLASAYAARANFSVAIARIYALIGPNLPLHGNFAAGNFIRDALAGMPVRIKGDGRSLRSYLYMADACIWLLRMIATAAPSGARQCYNLGSEKAISIAELAQRVVLGSGQSVEVMTQGLSVLPPPRYVPNTGKARAALGVAEYTDLDTAIGKTIAWTRKSTPF